MSIVEKAYLIEIKTKEKKQSCYWDSKVKLYSHLGIYKFGDHFLCGELSFDENDLFPLIVGDIAEIEYVCIVTSLNPLVFYFTAILKTPLVKNSLKSYKTKVEAFEAAIKTGIHFMSKENSQLPINIVHLDSLNEIHKNQMAKISKQIKKDEMHKNQIAKIFKQIRKSDYPCSYYEYNAKGQLVFLKNYIRKQGIA